MCALLAPFDRMYQCTMTSSPSRVRLYQLNVEVERLLDDLDAALDKRNAARAMNGLPPIESPVVSREKHDAAIEALKAKPEKAENVRYFRRARPPP
jgi:hypothetical protein